MPEAEHLALDDTYRRQLIELFKGILALTRETHIKQLEIPVKADLSPPYPGEEIVILIDPELSTEPLATYYFRRAWSYFFIRTVLAGTFGPSALENMHRLTTAGPVRVSLAEELRSMEGIFYGAHVSVCRQLEAAPVISPYIGSGKANDADLVAFATWRDKLTSPFAKS